ncbi:MAG: 4a-hydroxytetrahydrobiopterin dehydratase [Pseudomonadota bacterium]
MVTRIGAAAGLSKLTGWSPVDGDKDAIQKIYRFSDFKTAFGFMTVCAEKADQMDHHPEWFNVYNRVEVTLTTHDASGVTDLDIELASFMDEVFAKLA